MAHILGTVVTVAASGPDNPRNDTASVVVRPDGTALLVWHRYDQSPEGGSDFGLAKIYSLVSGDGGRTWGQQRLVVDTTEQDINVQCPALCYLPDGRLLLLANRAHGKSSTTMQLWRSTDDGESFEYQRDIWTRSDGQWLQGGAAGLYLLQGGRLLLPFHGGTGEQGSQHNVVHCFVSEDSGESWRLTEHVMDLPMRGAMEPSVAEASDGSLLMSLRTQLGTVFLARSSDAGETWSRPQPTNLVAPESCTCLRRIPGGDRFLLVYNDAEYDPRHHHYGIRSPLSLAVSDDFGLSFRKLGDISGGDRMHTNLNCTFLSDGSALITYCVCDDSETQDGVWMGREPNRRWQIDHIDLQAAIVAEDALH